MHWKTPPLQNESKQTRCPRGTLFPMHAFFIYCMYLVKFVYFVIWIFFFFLDVIKLRKVKYRHHLGYFCIIRSTCQR